MSKQFVEASESKEFFAFNQGRDFMAEELIYWGELLSEALELELKQVPVNLLGILRVEDSLHEATTVVEDPLDLFDQVLASAIFSHFRLKVELQHLEPIQNLHFAHQQFPRALLDIYKYGVLVEEGDALSQKLRQSPQVNMSLGDFDVFELGEYLVVFLKLCLCDPLLGFALSLLQFGLALPGRVPRGQHLSNFGSPVAIRSRKDFAE